MEAIEILLQVMENGRECLVVVLAGYRDRMDELFALNPGMASRVAHDEALREWVTATPRALMRIEAQDIA